jgi:hypothetical protein
MTHKKLRLHNTQADNLISNLRGELGEVILSWILYRYLRAQAAPRLTEDPTAISRDPFLFILDALMERLEDDICARLSELAQDKIGRLNFAFASHKLGALRQEVQDFSAFVDRSRIKEKRDRYISHKELPETWQEHRYLHIEYPVLVEGIARALRLMKKIDREYLGATSAALWREMRKKRYDFSMTPKAGYMLLPYFRLTPEDLRVAPPGTDSSDA